MERLDDDVLQYVVSCSDAPALVLKLVTSRWKRIFPARTTTSVPQMMTSLSLVRWARDNGCPWSEHMCAHAAHDGNLELLRWLRSEECPWDSWTCTMASGGGHLSVLQWAREQGCPWDERACMLAAERGQFEVLKWIHNHGPHPMIDNPFEVLHWIRTQTY